MALLLAPAAAAQVAEPSATTAAKVAEPSATTGAKIAEPPTIWTGPMQSETPATLSGAQVIDAEAVGRLKDQGAILLDVAAPTPKPEKLSQNAPWMPVHMSIPGAIWLASAGAGNLSPELQDRFGARIAALSGGDRNKPVVVFCHLKCWGSWNAGKRLVQLGYRKVFWFPGGVEAWQEKFAAAPVEEDAPWAGR